MSGIRFSMAGSGNWRRWFPDDAACALYERIYPRGARLDELPADERRRVEGWQAPGFIAVRDGVAVPLVPVFTDSDRAELATWFTVATEQAVAVLRDRIGDYRRLADALSVGGRVPRDPLLTLLLCAHTLDMGTLEELEKGALGRPPSRADSGEYFLWGTSVQGDPTCAFGVNSMHIGDGWLVSAIHSGSVRRAAPRAGVLAIPVLDAAAMQRVNDLCVPTSRRLAEVFLANVERLEGQVERCSFAACSRPDCLCMLFHLGYPRVAGALVEAGLLPAFPARVDDSWGLWISAPLPE